MEPLVKAAPEPFLDLLGLFGTSTLEVMSTPEPVPLGQELRQPRALPREIAGALIRSMLVTIARPVPLAEGTTVSVEVQAPQLPDLPLDPDCAADDAEWDLPFDWIAPEELVQDEEEKVEVPLNAQTAAPPIVAAEAPPLVVYVEDKPIEISTPQINDQPSPQPKTAELSTADLLPKPQVDRPIVVPRRPVADLKETTAEPLAFALKLTAKAPPSTGDVVVAQEPQRNVEVSLVPPTVSAEPEPVVALREAPPIKATESTDEIPREIETARKDTSSESDRQPSGEKREVKRPGDVESAHRTPVKPVSEEFTQPVHQSSLVPRAPARVFEPTAEKAVLRVATASVVEPMEKPEIRTGHAHEIAVRISSPDAVPIDLRIHQRGGEVHVAVRTADAELNTSLRHDLGTLVDRLEQQGFRAESATPRAEGVAALDISGAIRTSAGEGASSSNDRPSEGEGDSARGQQNPDSGEPQQRRQNSSRQKWQRAMEGEE